MNTTTDDDTDSISTVASSSFSLASTPVLLNATIDAREDVAKAMNTVQYAVSTSSVATALVCTAIHSLVDILNPLCAWGSAVVTRWLAALCGRKIAQQHISNWKHTKKLFQNPADHQFWINVLMQHAPLSSADSSSVTSPAFSLSLLRFLHAEHESIQSVYRTTESLHALWTEVYHMNVRLPLVVVHIGNAPVKANLLALSLYSKHRHNKYMKNDVR